MFGLRKFEHILRFRKFRIYTDASSLKYLYNLKNPKGIMARWLLELQTYDFEVIHKPGKLNGNADKLSRCNHLPPCSEEEEKEHALDYSNNQPTFISGMLDEVEEKAFMRETLIKCQKEDKVLKKVRQWIQKDVKPTKEEIQGESEELKKYVQLLDSIRIKNDLLIIVNIGNRWAEDIIERALIPRRLRRTVYYWNHEHFSAGHFGQRGTILRAQERFYYPGMTEDLKRRVAECPTCLVKQRKVNLKCGEHKPRITGYPGEKVHIDLCGPFNTTKDGNKYIFTIQDNFTKYVLAIPIPNKEASTCARYLVDRYITLFGCPIQIHSDRGTEFTNKIWHELMDRLRIKKSETTAADNQHSNIVERWHRTMNQLMRTFIDREDSEWDLYCGAACLAYNTKVNKTTGVTPFMAWMGRECTLPLDLIAPSPQKNHTIQDHVDITIRRFQGMYEFMRKNTESAFKRNSRSYLGGTEQFKEGVQVWFSAQGRLKEKLQR